MGIVEAEHAPVVRSEPVRQEKGQVVTDRFARFVRPNLFSKDANTTGTAELRLLIRDFGEAFPSTFPIRHYPITADAKNASSVILHARRRVAVEAHDADPYPRRSSPANPAYPCIPTA